MKAEGGMDVSLQSRLTSYASARTLLLKVVCTHAISHKGNDNVHSTEPKRSMTYCTPTDISNRVDGSNHIGY